MTNYEISNNETMTNDRNSNDENFTAWQNSPLRFVIRDFVIRNFVIGSRFPFHHKFRQLSQPIRRRPQFVQRFQRQMQLLIRLAAAGVQA